MNAWRCGPNSLCSCVAYTASICFWIACDGIEGSKISTLGPNSGFAPFAASAGSAAASSQAKPNRLRNQGARLRGIGSLRGYHRICIVPDAKEKFVEAKPQIISDNGPQFIARDFKEFIRISGMTHVRTSPSYPQSNGKLERWHKSLKL